MTPGAGKGKRPSDWLYYAFAVVFALIAVRLMIWILTRAGVIPPADGDLVMLLALPVAALIILWLKPASGA